MHRSGEHRSLECTHARTLVGDLRAGQRQVREVPQARHVGHGAIAHRAALQVEVRQTPQPHTLRLIQQVRHAPVVHSRAALQAEACEPREAGDLQTAGDAHTAEAQVQLRQRHQRRKRSQRVVAHVALHQTTPARPTREK